jgi:hypothetical protein
MKTKRIWRERLAKEETKLAHYYDRTKKRFRHALPSKHARGKKLNPYQLDIGGYIFDKTTTYMVLGYLSIFAFFAVFLVLSGAIGGTTSTTKKAAAAENMIVNSISGPYVKPGNPITGGGWNDTPTIGMTGEYQAHTMAMTTKPDIISVEDAAPTSTPTPTTATQTTTPAPDGLPVDSPKYCTTPTGFLMLAVQAYDQGLTQGIVNMNGVDIDMGVGNGAFYDRWGDGCCDAYCRVVSNGKYWSCIGPETRTSQYLQSKPRGRKCTKYGNERNKLV